MAIKTLKILFFPLSLIIFHGQKSITKVVTLLTAVSAASVALNSSLPGEQRLQIACVDKTKFR